MNKNNLILLGFIVLKFILQYTIIDAGYDLHRDEYLHLDQGSHLAWGYLSVPPVTSWISFVIQLLGNSEFWVKFFPALFGCLTLVVVWKTVEALNGNLFALVLSALCVTFSVLLRLNTLYQPNSLDVLCWTLIYFTIIRYIQTEKPQWLFSAAVIFALAFLNKYNVAFLVIGLVPAILLTPQRKVVTDKNLYFAVALALVLIMPNLVWQYQNNFPVLHHMKLLAELQLVHVNRIDFLTGQLQFFISATVVLIAALVAFWVYEPFKKFRFLFFSMVFTLGVFVWFKAKDYYAIGIYPIYLAFGAVYLQYLLQHGWRRYLKPVLLAIPLILSIPMFMVAFPNRTPAYIIAHQERYKKIGMLRWEDGKDHQLPQDFADMLGWKELAEKTEALYSTLPAHEHTLVLCDNYGQAGAINYYAKNKNIHALSFNADYINWFNLDKKVVNLIRVKEYEVNSREFEKTSPVFETALLADSITNIYAREYRTQIFVFTQAKIDVRPRIRAEIEKEKREMGLLE
jgi:hypothetical protein